MNFITKKYDEAFINNNSVRTNYKKLINWFKNQDNNELRKKLIAKTLCVIPLTILSHSL